MAHDAIEILKEGLQAIVDKRLIELRMIPAFTLDTMQITDALYYEEFVENTDDAYEMIEVLMSKSSSDIHRITLRDWFVDYHFMHEVWIFQKHLDFDYVAHESKAREGRIKETLANKIRLLSPDSFEILLNEIFSELEGYEEPLQRPQSHDGGYEMVVRRSDKLTGSYDWILVQAKHQRGRVSVSQVRELIGTLDRESNLHRMRRYRGLMISIHPATDAARKDAADSSRNIDFLELDDLVDLMYANKIGWLSRELPFATTDSEFWRRFGDEDE